MDAIRRTTGSGRPTVLRLEVSPGHLPAVQRFADFAGLTAGRAVTRRLTSVFFDTPDRQLAASGTLLEVCQSGQRHVQRVEARGAPAGGGRISRTWENALPSPEPDASAIGDEDLRRLAMPLPGSRLEPVLCVEIRRSTRRLTADDGTEIAMTTIGGKTVPDTAGPPVAEVEIASRAGDPARAFETARAVMAAVPARLAAEPRAWRLLRLAAGAAPGWRKPVALELSAEATVEDALTAIVEHCVEHLTDNEACTRLTDHPEGVHQMRVALRRLRSALRIFRDVLPAGQYAAVTKEVRWLTQSLAEARDLDVFTEEIVGPVAAAFPEEPAFEPLLARLDGERAGARAAARAAIAEARFTGLLLDLGAWIAGRAWRNQPVSETSARLFQPITALAAPLLATRFKKVRKRGRRFGELTAEERHALRIDVKRLRYATDFFASLYGRKTVRPFVAALQKLQDGLGYMNDVEVARMLIERLTADAEPDATAAIRHAGAIVLGWHGHAAQAAERSLAGDVEALIDSKPFWKSGRSEAAPC